VGFFADAVQLFGVPKSVGQIYGLLYATPAPLTLADIVERLEISKGSASQGMQLLRSLGAIHETPAKSEILDDEFQTSSRQGRGTAYVPELGLRKLIGGVLREQVAPLASTSEARLARLQAIATEADGADGEFFSDGGPVEHVAKRLKTVLPALNLLLAPSLGLRSNFFRIRFLPRCLPSDATGEAVDSYHYKLAAISYRQF
jgi:hypothetical protein